MKMSISKMRKFYFLQMKWRLKCSASNITFSIPISTDKGQFYFNCNFGAMLRRYYLFHYPIPMTGFFLHCLFNDKVIFSICFHFYSFDFGIWLLLVISPFPFHSLKAHYSCVTSFLRQVFVQLGQKTFPLLFFLSGIQIQHTYAISELMKFLSSTIIKSLIFHLI